VTEHYDVVIVGTGAGGGTLAHTLAPSGKRILLLERGDFLPREMDNWDPGSVFVDGKYISADTWYDADGKPFQLQVHYFVGEAHELDNLYVVDTSIFPSIGAVNPALTAMANAIRVGEHLLSRMS
jgi:choline dehydrogenase-like flavoprotein